MDLQNGDVGVGTYKEEIMGLYDIVMLLVFGGSILFGYWKGLTWQIASLAAI
ncbi:MAG: hypothetical protein ACI814_002238, partial [Mariniblastus sp.]